MPFLSMIFPVGFVNWLALPLKHLIGKVEAIIQSWEKIRGRSREFGGLSAGQERVEIGGKVQPRRHNDVGWQ